VTSLFRMSKQHEAADDDDILHRVVCPMPFLPTAVDRLLLPYINPFAAVAFIALSLTITITSIIIAVAPKSLNVVVNCTESSTKEQHYNCGPKLSALTRTVTTAPTSEARTIPEADVGAFVGASVTSGHPVGAEVGMVVTPFAVGGFVGSISGMNSLTGQAALDPDRNSVLHRDFDATDPSQTSHLGCQAHCPLLSMRHPPVAGMVSNEQQVPWKT